MPTFAMLRGLVPAIGIFVLLMIVAAWQIEKRGHAKAKAQVVALNNELKRISTAKDEQRKETGRNIIIADKGRKQADTIARRIEAAPLSGACKTPDAVLSADL